MAKTWVRQAYWGKFTKAKQFRAKQNKAGVGAGSHTESLKNKNKNNTTNTHEKACRKITGN